MVPRRLRLVTCREASACPNKGSKINARDLASTAFSSPSVNSVPMRLPSRPSRAISTARLIRDSRTSGSYSLTWQRILSNIRRTPVSGRRHRYKAQMHSALDERSSTKFQVLETLGTIYDTAQQVIVLAESVRNTAHQRRRTIAVPMKPVALVKKCIPFLLLCSTSLFVTVCKTMGIWLLCCESFSYVESTFRRISKCGCCCYRFPAPILLQF